MLQTKSALNGHVDGQSKAAARAAALQNLAEFKGQEKARRLIELMRGLRQGAVKEGSYE